MLPFRTQRGKSDLAGTFLATSIFLLAFVASRADGPAPPPSPVVGAPETGDGGVPAPSSPEDRVRENERCSLYLAASSIPDAGLGTYAGVARDIGDEIAPPEPAHMVLDLLYHAGAAAANTALMSNYEWEASDCLGDMEARKAHTLM